METTTTTVGNETSTSETIIRTFASVAIVYGAWKLGSVVRSKLADRKANRVAPEETN